MTDYLWQAVQATAMPGETPLQLQRRHVYMCALWSHSQGNTVAVTREQRHRLKELSHVWAAWKWTRHRHTRAARVLQQWLRRRPRTTGAAPKKRRRKHRKGLKHVHASIDTAVAQELASAPPFPFDPQPPWETVLSDFRAQAAARWSGRVTVTDALHVMFYILHTTHGTQRTVAALLANSVTLEEMQTGRVWVKACPDAATFTVVRMHGGGIRPSVALGPIGVLRVPFTVLCRGVWSAPMWVNVGAMLAIETFKAHLERYILSPSVAKLTSVLRDLRAPDTATQSVLVKLVALVGTGTTSYVKCSNLVFNTRWRMATWWSFWRAAMPLPYTREVSILRFIMFTRYGTEMLVTTLERCSVRRMDLLLGRCYLRIVPSDRNDLHELTFTVESNGRTVPMSPHATTLCGMGPCRVPVLVNSTFVWINVAALRHARCSAQWARMVYTFVMYQLIVLLRALRKWVVWRRKTFGSKQK